MRDVEKEKAALAVQHTKAQEEVSDIERMEQEYMADLANKKAQEDAARAQLDKVFSDIEWSKNKYAGGAMAWPLPGFSTISSPYGTRFSGQDFHTGMDITGSGCYGHDIVAANDGVVAKVNYTYTNGVGYGIYLIIDHGVDENGNSISTLYGHCSAIGVSAGQTVTRGQVIAQVGQTGWATGPHLHFEVRINGSSVNPYPYVS
jgi:murein DD-endopeptidase MepM/ murein hydrolase activator NlpD